MEKTTEKSEVLDKAENEVLRDLMTKRLEAQESVKKLQESLSKEEYFSKVYPKGMEAKVSGQFLQDLHQFLSLQEQYTYKVEEILGQAMGVLSASVIDNCLVAESLLNLHKSVVDEGLTITKEEQDAIDAKADIKPISTGKKKG